MKRYILRPEHKRWRAALLVCEDGLVTIYAAQDGTFGHCWPGEMAFGPNGIRRFLVETDPDYAADKFTMYAPKHGKKEAKAFIMQLWPAFVKVLQDELANEHTATKMEVPS